ncbi:AAA family ATPase [Chloroflexota bacterium]
MKVIAIVGMPGTGKSEVARLFARNGFSSIRFGDITDAEVKKRGLELNEANERRVRELLRQEHGMATYARLNLPKIDRALEQANVVIDGLYSWEEYTFLKERFGSEFLVVAVWSSPTTRYDRLGKRGHRELTPQEASQRDRAEIENVNKGGPIAMADYTISNETTVAELERQAERIITELE